MIKIEELVEVGAHFGHPTSKWNPNFQPYIASKKNGIHIINLKETNNCLQRAVKEIEKIIKADGTILFVGTKKQAKDVVQTSADEKDRYPEAQRIISEPLEMDDIDFKVDYFILATHHRNDDKITCEALKKGISYVGVVASKKKTGIITEYLLKNGISAADIKRFHAPTGLDLKSKSAEEIALSILSEIVMLKNGGTGEPMRNLENSD